MSFEEDTELKHLVAQTLENKGILPKIRAELRANVFLALEENPSTKETLLKNNELSAFVKIPIGSIILNLIREFLEFFELEFTLSVFDPETKYGKEYSGIAKDKMMKELKLTECSNKSPLLYEVIERVINGNEINGTSDKGHEDLSHCDLSGGDDDGHLMPSPIGLNSTYTKAKPDLETVPERSIEKEGDEENESIKEELVSNNVSESESIGDPKFILSPKLENAEDNLLSINSSKASKSHSQKTEPENPVEIDLLTFTPVKEKPVDNQKSSSSPIKNETKTADKKENEGTILGDLPPLTLKSEEKEDKMSKIKAIIDRWPGLENEDESSAGSKSSKDQLNDDKLSTNLKSDRSDYSQNFSQKSEIAEDLEEDISDLINGHTSSDGQLTIDETISKTSCTADYLESL